MKTPFSPKRAKGFTLIELMVAMAITTVIVTVLVSITGVALDTWQRGRAEIRASRQAKSMLDTMAKDFESLVSRRGNNFEWLYSKVESDLPGPAANMSSNAAEVIFFTAATDRYEGQIGTDEDLGGDVSCVSYQLQYQDPVKGTEEENSSTFVLYRLLVNPDDTFKDLLGKEDLSSAFSTEYKNKVKEVENFVCENIYQFTLTYQVEVTQTAGTTTTTVPVRVTLGETGAGKEDLSSAFSTKYKQEVKEVENFVCENIYQFTLTYQVEVTQTTGTTTTTVPVRVTLGETGAGKELTLRGNGMEMPNLSVGSIKPTVTSEELLAGRLTGVEIGITVLSDAAVIRLAQEGLSDKVREKILAQESFQYSRTVELPGM